MMKKTADMKEVKERPAAKKSRRMDEEKVERLSFEETATEQADRPAEKKAEEREPRRSYERRGGDRDGRGSYERRGDGWRNDRGRDRGYRSSDRDRGYDRPRRYDDDYSRDRYNDRGRDYDRPRYRDDYRSRDSYYSDRPRYRDDYDRERRPYGEKESYRQREGWPGRRGDDRPRRERDWDNETGRMYRGDRRGDRRPLRYSETGEDRRPFGDQRRRRNAPKPYGYDSFMITKNRDTADVSWLKNTEIRDDSED